MAKKAQLDEVRPVLEAADKGLDKVEQLLDGLDKAVDTGTDVVEAGLEKAADVVPDALDTSVHATTEGGRKVLHFFRSPKHAAVTVVILASAAGVAIGTAGYFLAVKRLKAKIQAEADLELEQTIAEIRRQYEVRARYATPGEAAEDLLPKDVQATLKTYRGQGGEPQNVKVETAPPVEQNLEDLSIEDQEAVLRAKGFTDQQIHEALGTEYVDLEALREKMNSGQPVNVTETTNNIFVEGRSIEEFDYANEVAKRDPEFPYVITHDEFMENENGWTQGTLTYYNGDDVLTDDKDIPIPDIEALVDSENLTKFGYGSRDRNVVYVRNERIETDFEIHLSQGEFSKEVAGFSELKHSAPVRRFRSGDDE